ncbi:sensor histidine kinase [Pseudodesulfovibrio sediminis]|uniref:histidine kinase n=1 Tax=Pseudodesulfovibrio sediminis TaxID=2810563 RepID=A0ABN6ELE8_9BACT|nr:7TM diverse intracellular signaling domain-containing protein [Pseudodesulfovibrio sediminis]BCS86851.1 sensor histidine kinase [Pseudodesulfovibrio sediminis]
MKRLTAINAPTGRRRTRQYILASLLCVVLVVVMACTGGCLRQSSVPPKAVAGVLDIRGIDLAQSGPLSLHGEWEFYWDRLLTPADFLAEAPEPSGMFTLPGTWNHAPEELNLSRTGQATYRLHLLTNPGDAPLEIRLVDIQMAYKLWANGVVVAHSGIVGISAEDEAPKRSLRIGEIVSRDGKVELVLQVSNHHFRVGGIPETIVVGPVGALQEQRTQAWALALFFAGSILVIGVYHLTLYFVRRRDVAPLYFGLYCLLTIGYTINSNTSGWVMTMLVPDINPAFMENFALLCYMAWPSARFRFFKTLYPEEFHKTIYRLGDVRTVVFIGFMLFAPGVSLYWYVLGCLVMSLVFGLYNIQRLTISVRQGRAGAWLMLTGCTIHMVLGINDILVHANWLDSSYVVEIGMFIFALCQAVALAQYTNSAFQAVAQLSGELENKNLRLQEEMEERDRLEREVVNISEEERRRISHELHDGLCQNLTGARLRATALKRRLKETDGGEDIEMLSALLDASVNDAYNTSHGLWPVEHDPDMPGPSLSDLARRVSKASGMNVTFEKNLRCVHCDNPHATMLYRIAQEALANAVKHSQANSVSMTLRCEGSRCLVLTVCDDGIGREAASKIENERTGGIGLGIMNHRARIIGAELRIEDAQDCGTVVTCSIDCTTSPGGAENWGEGA